LQTFREFAANARGKNVAANANMPHAAPNFILQLIRAQLFAGKRDDAVRSFSQFVRMDHSMMAVNVDARLHLLWATEVALDSGGA